MEAERWFQVDEFLLRRFGQWGKRGGGALWGEVGGGGGTVLSMYFLHWWWRLVNVYNRSPLKSLANLDILFRYSFKLILSSCPFLPLSFSPLLLSPRTVRHSQKPLIGDDKPPLAQDSSPDTQWPASTGISVHSVAARHTLTHTHLEVFTCQYISLSKAPIHSLSQVYTSPTTPQSKRD